MKCTAKSSRTGEHCKAWAVKGSKVCRVHGGAAPQTRRKAAERVVQVEAAAVVSKAMRLGEITPITNPLEALSALAGELVAVKDFLRAKVAEIEEIRTLDDKRGEQLRAEFSAYMGMLNSCVGGLVSIGKLNIDERMARVTEKQVEGLMAAMKQGFAAAGVTGDALEAGMKAVGKALRSQGGA